APAELQPAPARDQRHVAPVEHVVLAGPFEERQRPAPEWRRRLADVLRDRRRFLDRAGAGGWHGGNRIRPGMIAAFMSDPEKTLSERLLAGDRRALARAITLVENDDPAGWQLVREVFPQTGRAAVIGFTGPPGVGKSTLLGALTKHEREREKTVAVLSIDPSSPFTKGALLGDRIRLSDHFLDPGVFIRSMANRGALGGLSEATLQAALLMDASGRDIVLLETV